MAATTLHASTASEADLSEPLALRLERVSKAFGGLRAVDDVALAVRPGERRALIGPNGAGKTTLFNLVAGALPVTAGRIELFGRDVTRMPAHLLAVQALTAAKFVMHRPLARDAALRARAEETLAAVGLADRAAATVRNLSHGEQRQLEIGLALAGRPRLLLLDEPTAGLSPAESAAMARLLGRLDPAITVLIIEHDMDIALEVARHVTVLHYGRVIADGTRDAVRADPTVREIYLGA